jgi:hypothetical protein
MPPDLQALSFQTGSIFTPGAPINEKDLFAGRSEQVEKIIDAVSQRGRHAILYGERGVGKTSLSNMISAFLANRLSFVISGTNCDISDSYSSLWAKALKDIEASKRQPQLGFPSRQAVPLTAPAYEALTPDSVRRALQDLSTMASLIVIFDEFESIKALYNDAVHSPRPGHIYKEVLLACALAEVDDLRFFTTAAVKRPLSKITDREFESFNYARHLKDLSEPGRGRVLQRVGESFRVRYRISNPILRPYIIMRGIKDKLITKDQIPEGKTIADVRVEAVPHAQREYQPGL